MPSSVDYWLQPDLGGGEGPEKDEIITPEDPRGFDLDMPRHWLGDMVRALGDRPMLRFEQLETQSHGHRYFDLQFPDDSERLRSLQSAVSQGRINLLSVNMPEAFFDRIEPYQRVFAINDIAYQLLKQRSGETEAVNVPNYASRLKTIKRIDNMRNWLLSADSEFAELATSDVNREIDAIALLAEVWTRDMLQELFRNSESLQGYWADFTGNYADHSINGSLGGDLAVRSYADGMPTMNMMIDVKSGRGKKKGQKFGLNTMEDCYVVTLGLGNLLDNVGTDWETQARQIRTEIVLYHDSGPFFNFKKSKQQMLLVKFMEMINAQCDIVVRHAPVTDRYVRANGLAGSFHRDIRSALDQLGLST